MCEGLRVLEGVRESVWDILMIVVNVEYQKRLMTQTNVCPPQPNHLAFVLDCMY